MTEIKYVSSDGKEYNFNCNNVKLTETSFHKHSWNITTSKGRKNKLFNKVELEPAIYEILVVVRGTLEERTAFVNSFIDSADRDVIVNIQSTIFVNNMYAKGFFTSIESCAQENKGCWSELKLKFYCPEAVWVTEKTYEFLKQEDDELKADVTLPEKGMVFKEFEFDFLKKKGEAVVDNSESISDTDFVMKIYGFVDTPKVIINEHQYVVNTTLYDGERIEINSKEGTIMKIGRLGETTNLYNARGKEQSVFKKIPKGIHMVAWSGGFGFDLTLKNERSEPRWNV